MSAFALFASGRSCVCYNLLAFLLSKPVRVSSFRNPVIPAGMLDVRAIIAVYYLYVAVLVFFDDASCLVGQARLQVWRMCPGQLSAGRFLAEGKCSCHRI